MSGKPERYGITCHPPCVWTNGKRQSMEGEEWVDLQREREVKIMHVVQVERPDKCSFHENIPYNKTTCLGNSFLLF